MEVFTGDHGLPSDVVFFPDTYLPTFALPTGDTFSDQHKISTDDPHFLPPQPPQKLRPIRCNGRIFSDCCSSDDPLETKQLTWQPDTGFYNTETDGGGCISPKASSLGLSSKEGQIEATLSSSSDEKEVNLQEANKEPLNKKKRKRKSRKKLESFIKSMIKTVMEMQEEMHGRLIETLEKRENERIVREEAWRQHEIERAKKDEQARAQEISRSLALISFIKSSLGQDIQIDASILNKQDATQIEGSSKHNADGNVEVICDSNSNVEESECNSSTRRWPKSEVQALITVRSALNQKFNEKGLKGSVWEEVAAGLSGMGYNRTPKKCKEKWENINKYYRRTMEKGKESVSKSQVCTYFAELEMLYKTGFIPGNSHDHDHDQSMEELQKDSE